MSTKEYLKRIHRLFIREVTEDLPVFPDWVWGEDEHGKLLTEPHPYQKDRRWFYVEIHVSNFGWFGPIALGIACTQPDETDAEMVSMWVLDELRQQGYGRQLIKSAGQRWPDLSWTDCDESRPFHEQLVREGIATKARSGYYHFNSTEADRSVTTLFLPSEY